MLRPFGCGSAFGHLEGPFVFTRRTMPENYHLERKEKAEKLVKQVTPTLLLRRNKKKNTTKKVRIRRSKEGKKALISERILSL